MDPVCTHSADVQPEKRNYSALLVADQLRCRMSLFGYISTSR